MNETLKTILTRRSTRKFLNKPIPAEDLDLIVQAALHAPSGMGKQTWQFTVVKNRDKIQKLAAVIGEVLGREGYDMYAPEVLVIPSNEKESRFGREDDACAMENIFLAAHSLGIGSVWINQLQNICDDPKIRAELTALGIPADHVVYGLAALGYPDDVKSEKARSGEVVVVE
mgnify:FL=1